MIVGITEHISQMHFLINSVIQPSCHFSYEPDALNICEHEEHVKSTLK